MTVRPENGGDPAAPVISAGRTLAFAQLLLGRALIVTAAIGLRSLFVIHFVSKDIDQYEAYGEYGWLGTYTFYAPLVGGLVASQWLGPRLAVGLGCIAVASGSMGLAVLDFSNVRWASLLVAGGTGLCTPTVFALAGELWRDRPGRLFAVFLAVEAASSWGGWGGYYDLGGLAEIEPGNGVPFVVFAVFAGVSALALAALFLPASRAQTSERGWVSSQAGSWRDVVVILLIGVPFAVVGQSWTDVTNHLRDLHAESVVHDVRDAWAIVTLVAVTIAAVAVWLITGRRGPRLTTLAVVGSAGLAIAPMLTLVPDGSFTRLLLAMVLAAIGDSIVAAVFLSAMVLAAPGRHLATAIGMWLVLPHAFWGWTGAPLVREVNVATSCWIVAATAVAAGLVVTRVLLRRRADTDAVGT